MNKHFLLTLTGPDQPGLVSDLADLITQHQGNWQQSRLSHLGGHFAGVVDITLPEDQVPAFEGGVVGLLEKGLNIVLHNATDEPASGQNTHRAHISVVGNDRPGIVAAIGQALALHAVNVEELQSDVADAPMASGPLFQCEMTVSCATAEQLDSARSAVESLAHDLMIDITQS